VGVIFLDQNGRVVASIREAQRLLAQDDGLCLRRDGLAAKLSTENRELRALVAGAIATSRRNGLAAGGVLAVTRPSDKRPFGVVVSPVGRDAFDANAGRPSAAVFITDPERKPESIDAALTRIYKLTPAEARLAQLLREGETLVQAAERLGVSHNTARTHLRAIYQKTGTSHQGDLVRVLLRGIACS
jgi:DNA-binding CsgD family transcriptional regulator